MGVERILTARLRQPIPSHEAASPLSVYGMGKPHRWFYRHRPENMP